MKVDTDNAVLSFSASYVRYRFALGQPGVCLGSALGPPLQTQKADPGFSWGLLSVRLGLATWAIKLR